MNERDAVIGAGIVGLALARALARRGRAVTVFDTDAPPQGASVRNFGTLWPVGQPSGHRRELAVASMTAWRQVLEDARLWSAPHGSLHLAYHDDELAVITEFADRARADRFDCDVLDAARTLDRCGFARAEGLRGALWSPHELQVNPRQVLHRLPEWLREQWHVRFELGAHVTSCDRGVVRAGRRTWEVDRVWLASGTDLRSLFPEEFAALGLRRCKLQMMRTSPVDWPVGPVLAGGLTLLHYDAFRACASLPALRQRLAEQWPLQLACGVHVLLSRHDDGQLVLGDSHEYDEAITPFDRPAIDALVLDYLATFVATRDVTISERWHGVYVKHAGQPFCVFSPEPCVTAVAGLGGHGMTLSFGLAEKVVADALG